MEEIKRKLDKKTIVLIAAILIAVVAAVAVIVAVSISNTEKEKNTPEVKAVAAYKALAEALYAEETSSFNDVYVVTDDFIVFVKGDIAEKTYTVGEKNYFDVNRGLVLTKKAFSDTNTKGNLIIQIDSNGNIFYRICQWNTTVVEDGEEVNKAQWIEFVVTNGKINTNPTVAI